MASVSIEEAETDVEPLRNVHARGANLSRRGDRELVMIPWLKTVRRVITAGLAAALLGAGFSAHALDPDKAFHHYVRDIWSIEQGLPQITANTITQDRLGYIWVGTQAGIARFDGVRFVTYNMENTPELPGLWTSSLLIDRQDRLWIGTYKGLAMYEDGRFHRVPAADLSHGLLDVQALALDGRGNVLVGTSSATAAK
ncbi:MAG: hypothetical protein LH470_08440 [Lysobacter sp.]|nr:hypothetical protein [Lysobacter sp.]